MSLCNLGHWNLFNNSMSQKLFELGPWSFGILIVIEVWIAWLPSGELLKILTELRPFSNLDIDTLLARYLENY